MGADAHDAYARGTSAYRRGDYAAAAREYAAADALAPNPVALQAAIDATVLGDDPVFGTTLLDRARGEPRTDALLTTMLEPNPVSLDQALREKHFERKYGPSAYYGQG